MKRTLLAAVVLVLVVAAAFIGARAVVRPSKAGVMIAADRAGRHPTAIAVQWSWTHLRWETHEIYDL